MPKQLDELIGIKDKKVLASFIKKSSERAGAHDYTSGVHASSGKFKNEKEHSELANKHRRAIVMALKKLSEDIIDRKHRFTIHKSGRLVGSAHTEDDAYNKVADLHDKNPGDYEIRDNEKNTQTKWAHYQMGSKFGQEIANKLIGNLPEENELEEQKDTARVHHVIVGSHRIEGGKVENRGFVGQKNKSGNGHKNVGEKDALVFNSKKEADAHIKTLPKEVTRKTYGVDLVHQYAYKSVKKRTPEEQKEKHPLLISKEFGGPYSVKMHEDVVTEVSVDLLTRYKDSGGKTERGMRLATNKIRKANNAKDFLDLDGGNLMTSTPPKIASTKNKKQSVKRNLPFRIWDEVEYNIDEEQAVNREIDRPIKGYKVVNKTTGQTNDFVNNKSDAYNTRKDIDTVNNSQSDESDHRVIPSFRKTKIKEALANFKPKKLRDENPEPTLSRDEYEGDNAPDRVFTQKMDDNTIVWPDAAGNGDDVYKASNIKRDEKRLLPGQDENKYKEWNRIVNKIPVRKNDR